MEITELSQSPCEKSQGSALEGIQAAGRLGFWMEDEASLSPTLHHRPPPPLPPSQIPTLSQVDFLVKVSK